MAGKEGDFPIGRGSESMGEGGGYGEGRVATRPVDRVNLREAENLGEEMAAQVARNTAPAPVNAKHGTLYRRPTHEGLE